jgi:AcrR family transcriptional regulator
MSDEYNVTMPTRRYEQRLRAQTAGETRRRVLDALYDRLREAPAEPVSVDRIARTAGVARSTVYVIFGSRAGLFDAFAADLLESGGFHRVLDAVADPDPRVSLREGIPGGVHTFAAHRDVYRALISMAALDPDAAGGAMQRSEQRRAKGMMRLARRLARHGLLREGLTAKKAADQLWVLTSFDAFDLLYTGRGLSANEVGRVLVDIAERSVLASFGPTYPTIASARSSARA